MHHKAHIGFVDAHAERVGGDHHAGFPFHPALLLAVALPGLQTGMVIVGGNAVISQKLSGFRRALAVAHIHDARARITVHDSQHPALLILLIHHKIGEIGTLETLLEDILRLEVETQLDVLDHFRRGSGGERQHGDLREYLADLRDFEVWRTEIITPLRNAMRLVHGNHGDGHTLEIDLEMVRLKTFRRNVQKAVFRIEKDIVDGGLYFALPHSGIDGTGLDAAGAQMLHLVLHQRNERGNHDAEAALDERRHLKADGLAAARGKQRQCVAVLQNRKDNVLLQRPEAVVPPIPLQRLATAPPQSLTPLWIIRKIAHRWRNSLFYLLAIFLEIGPTGRMLNAPKKPKPFFIFV